MLAVDIGTRPPTLLTITHLTMVDCCVNLVLLTMWMIVKMKTKEVIVGVMAQDIKLGIKISTTITFTTMEKVLMVMEEVNIGIRPAPPTPIIKLSLVDHWVYSYFITEVDIGLRTSNFLLINMVDYTFTTQGFFKKLLQGACKEKIHIKIFLIIHIHACQHNLIKSYHNILIGKNQYHVEFSVDGS